MLILLHVFVIAQQYRKDCCMGRQKLKRLDLIMVDKIVTDLKAGKNSSCKWVNWSHGPQRMFSLSKCVTTVSETKSLLCFV